MDQAFTYFQEQDEKEYESLKEKQEFNRLKKQSEKYSMNDAPSVIEEMKKEFDVEVDRTGIKFSIIYMLLKSDRITYFDFDYIIKTNSKEI